jgi:hypothetical protein
MICELKIIHIDVAARGVRAIQDSQTEGFAVVL